MCDMGLILGMAAAGSQVAAQASAANTNAEIIKRNTQLNYAGLERDFITKTDAANKEGYQATLEGDRAKSTAVVQGAGMHGATPGLRYAEQSRQTALSISSAKDRADAASAGYVAEGKLIQNNSQDAMNKQASLDPMSAFMDIATSGLSNYGAFK